MSAALVGVVEGFEAELATYVVEKASGQQGNKGFAGKGKLERNAVKVLSGFAIAAWFNDLGWHRGFNRVAPGRAAHGGRSAPAQTLKRNSKTA